MRYLAFAALAALSIGLMGAQPASAAHERHEASGKASYASKKAYKKASYKKYRKAAYKKATYKKAAYKKKAYKKSAYKKSVRKHATYKKAKRTVASSGSYGGGSHGIASYYWQGQKTASGARFNPSGMTAAHRSLPFGTRVLVTNRNNGRSVTVTINDRGPFIKGRIIDLSRGAAGVIGMTGSGLAPVSIQVLGRG
jgi:rare lipoprotein A